MSLSARNTDLTNETQDRKAVMMKLLLAVLPMLAVVTFGYDASAKPKCPKGTSYDAATGKCIGKRMGY